jgi:cystathionine beta-synthase
VFNEDWLREHGMLDRPALTATVADVLRAKRLEEPEIPSVVSVGRDQRIGEVIELFQRYGISQIPVMANGDCFPCGLDQIQGSVLERQLLERVFRDGKETLDLPVSEAMNDPLAIVRAEQPIDEIFGELQAQSAVVVAEHGAAAGVLTRTDLLEFLAHRR